ncbi:MAG: SMP-30/gluconolactonase/LRE family protein [Lachnospiraceae bacterium]|nr:SMP-30/gluconolactonase/LRE family protein [Lachnospiraceae bacterium]
MKKIIQLRKIIALCMTVFLLALMAGENVYATSLPYDTYNYDYREYIHFTPAPYIPSGMVKGEDFTWNGESIGKFVTPQDLCQADDGNIYIADTGNNRIVVLDHDMKNVVNVITTFDNEGSEDTFKQPYGVCVSENGQIYVADSQNNRVVVLNKDGSLEKIVANPQSESLEDGYIFVPLKVAVDYADRIYVIAQNMFEGIMVFESNGSFSSFFGTIEVQISLWEKFWKRLATKEERSKQVLFIPTEFTGIDIDPEGFVYASNIDPTGVQGVRRLNPRGEDVIKKGENGNVGGDLWIDGSTDYAGPSQLTDVVYRQNGIYSCLDRKRGRIFTYDHEGNLLYIFGGLGTQEGTFQMPVAIEDIGGMLVVLDATTASILCFSETEYGRLINEAVSLRYDGDEAEAVDLWNRVLELDENNELANTGIGKAYLTAGDYVSAMKYLELGMNRDYYSVAYRRYRNGMLTENASYFLTGAAVLIVAWLIYKNVRKRKKGGAENA